MRVTVRVTPGARTTGVGGRYGEAEPAVLLVRVTARAVDGRANDAVVTALAAALGVARRQVSLVGGRHSRTKTLEVTGADPATLVRLLARGPGAADASGSAYPHQG